MKTMTTAEKIGDLFAKRKPIKDTEEYGGHIRPVYCKDGVSLSVQASRKHCCTPKTNEGPYTAFEVGFPTAPPPESWAAYSEHYVAKPCDTVYKFVPIETIAQFIDMHGGMREVDAPKLIVPAAPAPPVLQGIAKKRYEMTVEDLMGFKA